MKFTLIYIWLHDSKLSTQNV